MVSTAPQRHRLSFAPAWKLSIAAVVGVASVVVAAWLLGSLFLGGPAASQEPGPGTSVTAEPTPSSEATATVKPTPVLTPIPTPVAAWIGLEWTVGSTADGSWWNINDVVAWRDGYVGVGSSMHGGLSRTSTTSPAFFASADGLHWTIVQEDGPIDHGLASTSDEFFPARIVPVGDTLLAVGPTPPAPIAPRLWRSEDGSTWSLLDNSSWNEAMSSNALLSVAGGPRGVVVVGAVGNSGAKPQGPPVLIHSSDGLTWDRIELPPSVFQGAYFRDVTADADGFVIVGRVGEADVLEPGVGMPAAWTSPDGVNWLAAKVEGPYVIGARLETVIAGAEGLFATGRQTDTPDLSGQGPVSGWASTDGRSWRLLGEMGVDLPLAAQYPGHVAGDGAHMVIFGRESCKTTELLAWTSLDGVTWTQLAFSGEINLPTIGGPICNDDGTEGSAVGNLGISHVVVVPDGVFVVASSSAPAPPTYWSLTATTQ